MSREIMQQALSAFEEIMFTKNVGSSHIIAKNARYALREELAKPERIVTPDFPEPFSKADIQSSAPESWDDEMKNIWIDLQVCQRNKTQLHKYAKHLREMLGQALSQPEHPLDKKADNARKLGLDYEPEQELPPGVLGIRQHRIAG